MLSPLEGKLLKGRILHLFWSLAVLPTSTPVPRTESGIWCAFNKYVYGRNRDCYLSNVSQSPENGKLGPLFSAQRYQGKVSQFFFLTVTTFSQLVQE